MPDFLDIEILRLIWWAILGLLLIFFTVFDGFDMGAAMLIRIVGKTDEQRRIIINSVGPVWESNQVWLILGGGASFAAWPLVYSVSFSGLYFAFILALFAIIIRPVGFKFRSKVSNPTWRGIWDWSLGIGGFIAPFVFGVLFGNLLLGLPFSFDEDIRMTYHGSFFQLFTPFPLLCGLLGVMMALMQGATYLNIRTEDAVQRRINNAGLFSTLFVFILFGLGGLYIYNYVPAYEYASPVITNGPSVPTLKEIAKTGSWLSNANQYPILYTFPFACAFGLIVTFFGILAKRKYIPFLGSSLAIIGILGTVGTSMFPFLIPSSYNPSHSLTVWDASSSRLTLFIMLLSVIIFLPIILIYVSWVYKIIGGKVTEKTLDEEKLNAY